MEKAYLLRFTAAEQYAMTYSSLADWINNNKNQKSIGANAFLVRNISYRDPATAGRAIKVNGAIVADETEKLTSAIQPGGIVNINELRIEFPDGDALIEVQPIVNTHFYYEEIPIGEPSKKK